MSSSLISIYQSLVGAKSIIEDVIPELEGIAEYSKNELRKSKMILDEGLDNFKQKHLRNSLQELAQVSVILGVHYTHVLKNSGAEYISVANIIAEWALNFQEKYHDVEWADVFKQPMKYHFSDHVASLDEAIIDFGYDQMLKLDPNLNTLKRNTAFLTIHG